MDKTQLASAPSLPQSASQSANALWIVIAAHNEERVIGDVVDGLVPSSPNVVVVDDGSTDGTGQAARAHGAAVLRHVINLGQGAAIQTGIEYALRAGAEFIVTFDADGQHDPADLLVMKAELEQSGADVALGSRFLGTAPGLTLVRRLVLRLALVHQRLTSGIALTDAHNGLRLFRRAAAEKLRITQNRMAHASEITAQIAALGLRVVEVPCVVRYTAYSKQKGQRLSGAFEILLDLAMRRLHP